MRHALFLISSIAATGFSSLPAQAQWANYGGDDSIVRCESIDGRARHCATYGGDAQLVRQLSRSACIRGRTWGTDSRGIWVNSGCRAEFQINSGHGYDDYDHGYGHGGNDDLIRCESRDGRTERCRTNGGYAHLVRQLSRSPCVRGQSWGSDSRSVWVTNGCRAVFRTDDRYGNGYGNGYGNYGGYYGGDMVRCESRDNRSNSCAMPVGRNSHIRLLRQLSKSPCIEDQTWGQSRTGVWVTRGCRAEFVVVRGSRNNGNNGWLRPPGNLGGKLDSDPYPRVTSRGNNDVNPFPPSVGVQGAVAPPTQVEGARAPVRWSEPQPEQEQPTRRNPRTITTMVERTQDAGQPSTQQAVQPGVFEEAPAEAARAAERPPVREPLEERRQTPLR